MGLCIFLAAAAGVGAGEILEAACPCGYAAGNLWTGGGLEDPFLRFDVYYCSEWKEIVSVRFDGAPLFGTAVGRDLTPIRTTQEIWTFIQEHQAEYDAFLATWRPPDEVPADGFPADARVETGAHAGETPPSLLRVRDPLAAGALFFCPRCSQQRLAFRQAGWWD
jgi:hypothetical protein